MALDPAAANPLLQPPTLESTALQDPAVALGPAAGEWQWAVGGRWGEVGSGGQCSAVQCSARTLSGGAIKCQDTQLLLWPDSCRPAGLLCHRVQLLPAATSNTAPAPTTASDGDPTVALDPLAATSTYHHSGSYRASDGEPTARAALDPSYPLLQAESLPWSALPGARPKLPWS